MYKSVLSIAALAALWSFTTQAQEVRSSPPSHQRPGQAPVLSPKIETAPEQVTPWEALRRKLGTRNRIMLFWENELDTAVNTHYSDIETVERSGHIDADHNREHVHGTGDVYQVTQRYINGQAPVNERARGDSRQMQSIFMQGLNQGGVRFIDRTLATRLAGSTVDGERPNVHAIETKALINHADYLMQVITESSGLFHVEVISIKNGETLLTFETSATPAAPPKQKYIATSQGYQRAATPLANANQISEQLAIETGRGLASALDKAR